MRGRRPRTFEMAGELREGGALLDPEAMVPASPDLAAEEDPESRQEGEHFSPRWRAVLASAHSRPPSREVLWPESYRELESTNGKDT